MADKTPRKRVLTIADLMNNPVSGFTRNVASSTRVARNLPVGVKFNNMGQGEEEDLGKLSQEELAARIAKQNASVTQIKLKDTRKIVAASGKPINPNVDLKTGNYDANLIRDIIAASHAQGIDPYTALAVSLAETTWGKTDDNIGHVLYAKHPESFKNIPTKYNPDAYQYISVLKKNMGIGAGLYKDEAHILQANNGYGMISPNTEKNYYGKKNKKFYGVDVTTPISMKKNPLYGKTIIDLRDNVIKQNPDIANMIATYDPTSYDYSQTEEGKNMLPQFETMKQAIIDQGVFNPSGGKKQHGGTAGGLSNTQISSIGSGISGLMSIADVLMNPPLDYSRQPIINPDVARTMTSPYGYGGCADCNEERPQYGSGGWIKKAAASIKRRGTKGKCTPITKPGCTGRAKALAKTFKKIARNRKKKEYGGSTIPSYGERYVGKIAEKFAYGGDTMRRKYQHAGKVRPLPMSHSLAMNYGDIGRFQPTIALTPAQIALNKTKNAIVQQATNTYKQKVIAERKAAREYKKPAGAPTRESAARAAESVVENTRYFPNSVGGLGQMIDDYGLSGLARMVASPAQAPYEAQQTNSYRPYGLAALNLGMLGLGAMGRGGAAVEATGTDAATTNSLFGWQPRVRYSKYPYDDITATEGYTFSKPIEPALRSSIIKTLDLSNTPVPKGLSPVDPLKYSLQTEADWRIRNLLNNYYKLNAGAGIIRTNPVANPSASIYDMLKVDPDASFGINPNFTGTPTVLPMGELPPEAYFAMGGLTSSKAKEILHDGTAHGHPLTAKQRRYMGYIAGKNRHAYGGYKDTVLPIPKKYKKKGYSKEPEGIRGRPLVNAYGGQEYGDGGDVPIEVEGGEVVQQPGGLPVQMQGPSHEQGGVDMNVPEGTKIYSDRLAVDGESMKDRKVNREKRMAKLAKLLDKHPTDWLLKATVQRTAEADAMEEEQDMKVQDYANNIYTPPQDREQEGGQEDIQEGGQEEYAYGGRKKYQTGTGGVGGYTPYYGDGKPVLYDPYGFLTGTPAGTEAQKPAASTAKVGLDNYTPFYNTGVPDYNPYGFLTGLPAGTDISNPSKPPIPPSNRNMTAGDIVGGIGTGFGAAASLINTKNAFRATPPNINRYQGVGQRNIDLARHAQDYVAGSLATDLNDITTGYNTDVASNRNSAQGVNTLRALDTVAGINRNAGRSRARAASAELMSKLMGQEGQATAMQDIYQAQGASARDLETKQDIDAYYSNLGQDYAGISEGIQTIGKNMNITQENADTEDLIGMLSEFGVKTARGKDGRLHRVNG